MVSFDRGELWVVNVLQLGACALLAQCARDLCAKRLLGALCSCAVLSVECVVCVAGGGNVLYVCHVSRRYGEYGMPRYIALVMVYVYARTRRAAIKMMWVGKHNESAQNAEGRSLMVMRLQKPPSMKMDEV